MPETQPTLLPGTSLDEIYVTINDLAELYGVDDETTRLWEVKRNWISRSPRGFQLTGCIKGVYRGQAEAINRKKGPELPEGMESSDEADRRRKVADANIKELEEAEKRQDLLPRSEVEKIAFESARNLREALENIPSRVADLLAVESEPVKIKTALAKEIHQALEDLSK